jgi:hypothetical protein
VVGGYGLGLTETSQRSRSSGGTMSFLAESTWTAQVDEEEVFVFAGIDWAARPKLSFGVNYEFSRNVSTFDLGNGLNNAADLPQTIFRRHDVTLDTRWRWLANTTVVGRWAFQEYDVNDWATTDVPLIFPVTGTANAIFLGDSSRSYRAHRLALLVRHTF